MYLCLPPLPNIPCKFVPNFVHLAILFLSVLFWVFRLCYWLVSWSIFHHIYFFKRDSVKFFTISKFLRKHKETNVFKKFYIFVQIISVFFKKYINENMQNTSSLNDLTALNEKIKQESEKRVTKNETFKTDKGNLTRDEMKKNS